MFVSKCKREEKCTYSHPLHHRHETDTVESLSVFPILSLLLSHALFKEAGGQHPRSTLN